MPAVKKDASIRARTNRASTAATLSSAPRRKAAPALPRVRKWHPTTVAWWKDIWASPMSTEFHSSDLHQLFMLATLMDDFATAGGPTQRKELASEIRLQRASFGMTPYDRRRLEWTIEQVDEAKDRGVARRKRNASPPKAPAADPRSVLHAVK